MCIFKRARWSKPMFGVSSLDVEVKTNLLATVFHDLRRFREAKKKKGGLASDAR